MWACWRAEPISGGRQMRSIRNGAGRRARHPFRWPVTAALMVALAAAGLLAGGRPASAGAAATRAAGAAPGAPAGTGTARPYGSSTQVGACTKTAGGRMTDCPPPVRAALLPAGARDHAAVPGPVGDLAGLVDTRTWTTGGGNTFPGADVPFGMVQWSPDTLPNRSDGGGYSYGDSELTGYSLTHVSGPGCKAGGDVPILPMTGTLPAGNPSNVTTSFTNTGEVAQAGYYSAQSNLPDTITSQFTATPHSSMGAFTFPATTSADLLVKLMDSQTADTATSAQVVGDDEVTGSVTSGDFCGEANNGGQAQQYTVYFDIVFSQPFTASQVITETGQADPNSVLLTFDTTANPVVMAKVGISYVDAANARLDWQTENPGWNFGAVRSAAQRSWNDLLGRIKVSGGSYAQTQEFYSLLYKDFLQPNITSDVNGQYLGSDMKVHSLAPGQRDQYGIYSGWDIYHSLAQLQAMLDPRAAGDMATSLLNYYAQNGILQQWGYLNLDNYVMVGDPAQSMIADYYAFGARNFNTKQALTDMLRQATTVNDVRPGEALEQADGYLPQNGRYGCCNSHGYVPTLLEYDTEDLALSQFAGALGDHADAAMLERRANNWANVFDPADGLLNPRDADGSFVSGITPTSTSDYVEGTAYEYLWNVPNDYAGLFSLLGGDAAVVPELQQYLSQPNGHGMYALLSNEFDFGEQNALDYAGDPAGTQLAVNTMLNDMYLPGPSGLANNDDLGANSSAFIWEMLGMYPENSGSGNLVFASPGFPHAAITLPSGRTITISAPGASPTEFYADGLRLDGQPWNRLYVPYSTLARGATLDWTLGTSPTSWGSAPADAPPSYGPVFAGTASASPSALYLRPGASGSATVTAQSVTGTAATVRWTARATGGGKVSPSSGTLTVPAGGTASASVTVTAGPADGDDQVSFSLSGAAGAFAAAPLPLVVAQPGDLAPFDNVTAIGDDGSSARADFDGSGYSYSAQALAAAGLTPGATVTAGGMSFTWPGAPANQPDAIMATGQTIPVAAPAGTAQIGLLGSATNGGATGSQGTVTITYTDGSTSTATVGFTDWADVGKAPLYPGNVTAAATPYRDNEAGGRQALSVYLYAEAVPVDPTRTVASITLPATVNTGSIDVFAISAG
jgi:predicted alpha-1,2-mannosidase